MEIILSPALKALAPWLKLSFTSFQYFYLLLFCVLATLTKERPWPYLTEDKWDKMVGVHHTFHLLLLAPPYQRRKIQSLVAPCFGPTPPFSADANTIYGKLRFSDRFPIWDSTWQSHSARSSTCSPSDWKMFGEPAAKCLLVTQSEILKDLHVSFLHLFFASVRTLYSILSARPIWSSKFVSLRNATRQCSFVTACS